MTPPGSARRLPLAVCELDSAEAVNAESNSVSSEISLQNWLLARYKDPSNAPSLVSPTHAANTCPRRRVLDLTAPHTFPKRGASSLLPSGPSLVPW